MTDVLADHVNDILGFFRERTGVAHWTGTVGIGICASGREYLDQPAIAVMMAEFPSDSFQVFSGIRSMKELALRKFNSAIAQRILRSCMQIRATTKYRSSSAAWPANLKAVSSSADSQVRASQNVQIADKVTDGGISGVMFTDDVTIATRLTQGCSPIGPKRMVTQAQRNIILTIDDRPALDVLKEDVGERLARDINRLGGVIFAGIADRRHGYRRLSRAQSRRHRSCRGIVAIGDLVEAGNPIMFCRRDTESASKDMTRMLASIRRGFYSKPRGGVYYSCIGRGAICSGLILKNSDDQG